MDSVAYAPYAVAGWDRAAADVFAQSRERGAADDGEVAVPGADPGVWELAVARAAGASADLGTADRRGQSGDQGAVFLAVRAVWGGASAGTAEIHFMADHVVVLEAKRTNSTYPDHAVPTNHGCPRMALRGPLASLGSPSQLEVLELAFPEEA